LLDRGICIDFAHRTFKWANEAHEQAAVHVVIIGFSEGGLRPHKLLYDYETPTSAPQERIVGRINPYLADGPNVIVRPRREPLLPVRPIVFGSMPNDGGHLILSEAERERVISADPIASKYVRPLLGADGMLDGRQRWCLWLVDADPADLSSSPTLRSAIRGVFEHRTASKRAATRRLAATPALFGEIRQPSTRYLCVPRHSSESRRYIPMVFADASVIAHDSTATISEADDYLFGLLQSLMWMAWVRAVGGRIKSDFRISNELVYNTFPWPDAPSAARRSDVEDSAKEVLRIRADYPDSTLADLYGAMTMPAPLVKAHKALDRAVDGLYGRGRFDEVTRLAGLLERYRVLDGGLATQPVRRRGQARAR
jgi:hypothetical protein